MFGRIIKFIGVQSKILIFYERCGLESSRKQIISIRTFRKILSADPRRSYTC